MPLLRSLLTWLRARDPGYGAARRALRAAVIMPALFALGHEVLDNAEFAVFAAFGSVGLLLLTDFRGPIRNRMQAQASLGLAGAVLVCIGTLCSQQTWLAATSMALVGFGVLFSGVVSSTLAGATTPLLLSFILPVSLSAPPSAIGDRLAGWAVAAAISVVAVGLLWPIPVADPLRASAAAACRALGRRLRAEVAYLLSDETEQHRTDYAVAAEAAEQAMSALRQGFLTTPYRPTGLTTEARTTVRLVDELTWLHIIVGAGGTGGLPPKRPAGIPANVAICGVKSAAVDVLEGAADLLERHAGDPYALRDGVQRMHDALRAMERNATGDLPVRRQAAGMSEERMREFITSLDPTFRAQELSFAASLIASNAEVTAAAERRSWLARLLGRQPTGFAGTFTVVQERASAHFNRRSVWLHNSLRGAVGLGLAVWVAKLTGVQHSFWVVLGALSILRSNALNTGQNALRGLVGTVAGFVVGAALLQLVGTDLRLLWALLPVSVLLTGIAPAAISFTAGQAAFTLTIVVLFNIIDPVGYRVGLLRIEDVAIGCAVSVVVGVLFWPRGAGAALSRALSTAYRECAAYLVDAVDFGMSRCEPCAPGTVPPAPPTAPAQRAAAASRRLDDTFRNFLAEHGAKPIPLPDVTRLVTGIAGLRLTADAVLDLWSRDDGMTPGDRSAARHEVLVSVDQISAWYRTLAASLIDGSPVPDPLRHDVVADGRIIDAVRHDLRDADGRATATAVRMIWTGGHLDASRRLQAVLTDAARSVAAVQAANPKARLLPWPPARVRREPVARTA